MYFLSMLVGMALMYGILLIYSEVKSARHYKTMLARNKRTVTQLRRDNNDNRRN